MYASNLVIVRGGYGTGKVLLSNKLAQVEGRTVIDLGRHAHQANVDFDKQRVKQLLDAGQKVIVVDLFDQAEDIANIIKLCPDAIVLEPNNGSLELSKGWAALVKVNN